MKKIEFYIKETNLSDDFEPIESREFTTQTVMDEHIPGEFLFLMNIIDSKWYELKNYFLNERELVPFRPIRREHE